MNTNRLVAVVASSLGYSSHLEERDRLKMFGEARQLIKAIIANGQEHPLSDFVRVSQVGIDALDVLNKQLAAEMIGAAKKLPVAPWTLLPEQRGFGLLSLATVIGETGDLANYPNPAKVWKRLGCAPHHFRGQTLMPSTWKTGALGKLPAEEWVKLGYSPRRRSIAYTVGVNLLRSNRPARAQENAPVTDPAPVAPSGPSFPYLDRYTTAKEHAKTQHPDWKPLRLHRHALLLATKLLLKNLWIQWTQPNHQP
jgi:hypothetical protein